MKGRFEMGKGMNAPALRFPEFDDCWDHKVLGEVSTFLDGRRKPIKASDRAEIKGNYPYYGASGIIDYVNNYLFDEEIILLGEDGENILSRSLPLAFKVSGKCWVNNHAHVIKPNKITDIDFLTHSLERISYVQYNTGTAQPKLNQEVCRGIPLRIPSLSEQQKIASFLTSIDDKIQQLLKKKTLLEQYKKGLMQQIFSREIRFKDEEGKEYGEWEEKRLGEVLDFFSTNSFSRNLLNYEEGLVKNIHYGDIHTKFKTQFRIEEANVPFISSDVDISNISNSSYCKVGDLIIADASEDYKDVGKAIEIISLNNQKIVAGLHTFIARDKENERIAVGFKGYLMQSSLVRKQIMTMAVGISVLGISKINLAKVEIWLPSLPEQAKIAKSLSAIDEKINLLSRQLEQMRRYKKGLLQRMFV